MTRKQRGKSLVELKTAADAEFEAELERESQAWIKAMVEAFRGKGKPVEAKAPKGKAKKGR